MFTGTCIPGLVLVSMWMWPDGVNMTLIVWETVQYIIYKDMLHYTIILYRTNYVVFVSTSHASRGPGQSPNQKHILEQ